MIIGVYHAGGCGGVEGSVKSNGAHAKEAKIRTHENLKDTSDITVTTAMESLLLNSY